MRDYFEFLDELRESGVTNMWGASEYLEEEFDLDGKTATDVLLAWMKTFDGESSVEDRAAKAVTA